VTVVGLGNIGSFLIDHLARMPGVRRVVLIDRDRYDGAPDDPDAGGNFSSQCIRRPDRGRPKALVQARHLKELRPDLEVRALVRDAAEVPLGRWRARVIVAGLDSLAARLIVNEAAWRLGVPWIDAGVEPRTGLIRIHGYEPGPGNPCMACALEDTDYQQLGTRYVCGAPDPNPTPTNGPSPTGGIAAGLLATECAKILAGQKERVLFGRQLIVDTQHHRHYLTDFRVNPACRFDHASWPVQPLPEVSIRSTLRELLAAGDRLLGGAGQITVSFPGQGFALTLACPGCGRQVPCLRWEGRVPAPRRVCPACARPGLRATAFACASELDTSFPERVLGRTLGQSGLYPGDVVRFRTATASAHVEIPCEGV
jgi:molybdopterin/thiamine biosynthesis adenylyltransferase